MFRSGSRVFFVSVLRLCFVFVRAAFAFTTFHVGFAGHAFCNLFVCGLPCFERFALFCLGFCGLFLNSYVVCPAPFVGFAGYIWFSVIFARFLNVCPLFVWALRAILFSYVLCLLLKICPFCGPCIGYNLV